MMVVVERRRALAVSASSRINPPQAVPLVASCTEAMTTYKR